MAGSPSVAARALWLAAIAAVSLALRLYVIWHTQQAILFADMQDYHDRAVHLLNTGTLWPDAFRVPMYPIFIAGIFKAFGQSLLAVRMAQAALGAATAMLTYVLAARVVSERGARAASAVVAVYPALVLYSVYIMAETLFSVLALLALVFWTRERVWAACVAGAAAGAATLTRSVGLALLAAMVGSVLITGFARPRAFTRAAVARAGLVAAGFALALAPWAYRNYGVYQRLVLTDTSSGFNALLGNYPGATGRHPGIPAVEAAAQTYWQQTRNDLERSEVGLRVARELVASDPGRATALAARKVAYLFGVEGREHAWGQSYHVLGRHEAGTVRVWGLAIMASFPALFALASIGLWRPGLGASSTAVTIVMTLAAVTALHIASFGDTRFHLPWIPLLAILAARAFAPKAATPWTLLQQLALAVWLVAFALAWIDQARELLAVLPRLAESPVPLQLPY